MRSAHCLVERVTTDKADSGITPRKDQGRQRRIGPRAGRIATDTLDEGAPGGRVRAQKRGGGGKGPRPNPLPPKFPSTLVQALTHGHRACAVKVRPSSPGSGSKPRQAVAERYAAWPCRPFPPRGVMTSVPSIGDALVLRPEARDGRDKFVPASTNLGFGSPWPRATSKPARPCCPASA